MRKILSFIAFGAAQPKGSKKSIPNKRWTPGGNVPMSFVVDDNPKAGPWMKKVGQVAYDAALVAGIAGTPRYDSKKKCCVVENLIDDPIYLECRVFFERPKGHFNSKGELNSTGLRKRFPSVKPDLTKLVRAIEDAMIGVVLTEDSRIVTQFNEKRYCEAGERERVEVTLYSL